METSLGSLYDHNGRLMVFSSADLWGIYLAQFPSDHGLYVKVGISTAPYRRLWGIHSNNPFPLSTFSWAWVGQRQHAAFMESWTKKIFAEQRTRGEWYRFEDSPEDTDAKLRKLMDQANGRRDLDWKTGDLEGVLAFIALEVGTQKAKRAKKAATPSPALDTRNKPRKLWSRA